MLHVRKLAAALTLGTTLLATAPLAMAVTLPDADHARATFVHVGTPESAPVGKTASTPSGKPASAPVGNPPVDTGSTPAAADPRKSPLFVLGDAGFETVEFFVGFFYASQAFEVTRAGTYELTLTDLVFPESLRKIGATVTTAQDKLSEIFGSGSLLFDMDTGTHYLSYFAKAQMENELGLFGLTLRYYEGGATPVPVPGALWLLGSGLIGLAGMTRGRKLR